MFSSSLNDRFTCVLNVFLNHIKSQWFHSGQETWPALVFHFEYDRTGLNHNDLHHNNMLISGGLVGFGGGTVGPGMEFDMNRNAGSTYSWVKICSKTHL